MKEFICEGVVTIDALFFIKAETLEEAEELARAGKFESYKAEGGISDWDMDAGSVEENI